MTFRREVRVTVPAPVPTTWEFSLVLQKKLFPEESNWRPYVHPFSDRSTWIASSSGGTRYGYIVDVEAQKRIVVEVVESNALVRLTWTFEPMEQRRAHVCQLVEVIAPQRVKHQTIGDQVYQSGLRAMRVFHRHARSPSHPPRGMCLACDTQTANDEQLSSPYGGIRMPKGQTCPPSPSAPDR